MFDSRPDIFGIREWRRKIKPIVTNKELAIEAGVGVATVSYLENEAFPTSRESANGGNTLDLVKAAMNRLEARRNAPA